MMQRTNSCPFQALPRPTKTSGLSVLIGTQVREEKGMEACMPTAILPTVHIASAKLNHMAAQLQGGVSEIMRENRDKAACPTLRNGFENKPRAFQIRAQDLLFTRYFLCTSNNKTQWVQGQREKAWKCLVTFPTRPVIPLGNYLCYKKRRRDWWEAFTSAFSEATCSPCQTHVIAHDSRYLGHTFLVIYTWLYLLHPKYMYKKLHTVSESRNIWKIYTFYYL